MDAWKEAMLLLNYTSYKLCLSDSSANACPQTEDILVHNPS